MGVTASHQPPQIVHPTDGASGVPVDACVWGTGGTILTSSPAFRFEYSGGSIEGTYEAIGGHYILSPHGSEFRAIARVVPQEMLPQRSSVALVYDGRVLVTFETGSEPAPSSATPRRCAPPAAVGPSLRPSDLQGPGVTFAAELGEGVFVVDDGPNTWLALGPCVFVVVVAAGAKVRIRDAKLHTVYAEAV